MKVANLYRRTQDEFGDMTFPLSGHAFGTDATTSSVYEHTIRQSVFEVTEGVNTCVVAIGGLNSGKTHLMIGDSSQPGIISQVRLR